ncbi:hypothetical protein CsatA_023737 [Cannabis sativa]
MNRRVQDDWERLVRAILKREQLRAAGQRHERARTPSGIAGSVPASLLKTTNIDAILQVADEIQLEDPSVTRISNFNFILEEKLVDQKKIVFMQHLP